MIKTYKDIYPKIDPTAKVLEGAVVIGDVTLGKNVSIWYNAVVRGDMAKVEIGDDTNIQDGAVIHTNSNLPSIIGSGVTVGHNAIIHAATIEDDVLIGMGSIILDGAIIEKDAYVAAGTLVPPGKVVASKTLVMGSPMRVVRTLTEDEVEGIRTNKMHYLDLMKDH